MSVSFYSTQFPHWLIGYLVCGVRVGSLIKWAMGPFSESRGTLLPDRPLASKGHTLSLIQHQELLTSISTDS